MAKKDFSGKNKTKDTYDQDWVFLKTKPKGPNDSAGAWVTQAQARQAHEEQLKARQESEAAVAPPPSPPGVRPPPPGTPAAIGTAPILTSGLPVPPTPVNDPNIPNWWINEAITNPADPNQQFANAANALLPTLAPEDQRTLASYLATNFRDVYGNYNNVNFGAAPTEITDAVRKKYLSPQRASLALTLMDKMKTASGSQNMGAGYDFLKNAVNLINQFTTGGSMTRENYAQFTNALSGLTGQAGGDLKAYANLAQLFNLPSFSAGPLMSNTPNTRLFG